MFLQVQIQMNKIDKVLLVMEIETIYQLTLNDLQKIKIKQKI